VRKCTQGISLGASPADSVELSFGEHLMLQKRRRLDSIWSWSPWRRPSTSSLGTRSSNPCW